jgi:sodium/bile acid cotransporter 7
VKNRLLQNWFLIGLALVLTVGFLLSKRLEWLADAKLLRNLIVASVLFVMALPLEFGHLWRVLRRPGPALLAVAINFGLLPLLAWGVSLGLSGDMAIGLLIAAAMPCTLASASVWTRKAGGNDAVSILVTILTNLSCFVVTPLWLLITTRRADVDIPLNEMIVKLALLVVLPMFLAQIVRLWRPLGIWATRQTTALGVAAQMGVLSMILICSIKSGLELSGAKPGQTPTIWDFSTMIVAVISVHLAALWAGHILSRLVGLSRENRIAVGFAGSQKTLMVGLYVATTYYGGLAILPMVAYHVGQLLVDTLIAHRLKKGRKPAA